MRSRVPQGASAPPRYAYPDCPVLVQSFEARAAVHPQAVALICNGEKVTYGHLNERANRVARLLVKTGVPAGSIVGVFLDRTPDLVAALLGVWKACAAYLPLDPSHPAERIVFQIQDAGVRFMVTQSGLSETLTNPGLHCVLIDQLSESLPGRNLGKPQSAEDLANVIYTSGSTGNPKGSLISHGALANVFQSLGGQLRIKPGDVVLAQTTVAFDIASLELLMPLACGATVYLTSTECAADGETMVRVLHESHAAFLFGTPTSWRLLLEAGWRGNPRLTIVSGGETLPVNLARQLVERTAALWNHYGPTETTICATTSLVPAGVEKVGIGRPIDHVTIHLLDAHLEPVTTGQIGEIYIGGAGVGLGYLNRPELNENSFFDDPFDSQAGARLYKTGDLGRMTADGALEFLGRTDDQVKIRGFRVELQEIEAVIRQHLAIRDVALHSFEFEPGDRRIVAHVVTSGPASAGELKAFLADRLPPYMIPAEFQFREFLPLTRTGKIDRKALAMEAESARRELARAVGNAFDGDAKLRVLWENALGVGKVGPDDNFFELGGNSLAAARLFSQIRKHLGRRLPLSVLVHNPTLRGLSNYLRENQDKMVWAALVPLQERGTKPPLILLPGLGGNVLTFRQFPEHVSPDQPVYSMQLTPQTISIDTVVSIKGIAATFIEEIRQVFPSGPYHFGGYSVGGLLAFEMARQLREAGETVGLLALFDTDYKIFDPPKGLMDRWRILRRTARLWALKFPTKIALGPRELLRRRLFSIQLRLRLWLVKRARREDALHRKEFSLEDRFALAAEEYDAQPYPGNAVLVMARDEMVRDLPPEGIGWRRMVQGSFTMIETPGDHLNLFDEPHVGTLARNMEKLMRATEASMENQPAPESRALVPSSDATKVRS